MIGSLLEPSLHALRRGLLNRSRNFIGFTQLRASIYRLQVEPVHRISRMHFTYGKPRIDAFELRAARTI